MGQAIQAAMRRRAGFGLALMIGLGFTIPLLSVGCDQGREPGAGPAPAPTFRGVKLTVASLREPAILAGLSTLRGEWIASRGGEIGVREQPLRSQEEASGVDVLVFPAQELGSLVDAGRLEMIANSEVLPPPPPEGTANDTPDDLGRSIEESPAASFKYTDIVPAYREQVSKYGTDRFALPVGGSALVLVLRQDAFTGVKTQASAREAGVKLEPPSTWDELDALARFFQGRDWNGDGKPDSGLSVPLGRDGERLSEAIYLARAASLGQHRDHFSFLFDADSMAPRLESPPFTEALRSLVAWKAFGPPGMSAFDANAAREAFRKGDVAMLIDRAERAADWSHGHPLRVAPLPGSPRVYEPMRKAWESPDSPNRPSFLPGGGGWLVGVVSGLAGTQRDAALDLARYLASPENANRLRAERAFPMLAVRASQIGKGLPDPTSSPDVDSRQWSDAVSRTLMAERVVPGLRIPDADGYLGDLASGRIAAVEGKDVSQALAAVATSWKERTGTLGNQHQLWHYRRSLNTLATLPEPPPRGK